ncbi:MAG: histidine triad (HIT) family protein [Bacteroidia bacterium]|jgi:histidine triad (HIT) family protein
MPSIFSKIISGKIPAYKLAENEQYLAFLDVFPLRKGHALVIPKIEIDYIFNLDDEELQGLMVFAKKVAKAMEKAVPCKRIGVAVIGLEVPHTHIHLVPINKVSDINFAQEKQQFSANEMEEIARSIREHLVV